VAVVTQPALVVLVVQGFAAAVVVAVVAAQSPAVQLA
jgi:hypothetical protein